jgi:hypothetical protein
MSSVLVKFRWVILGAMSAAAGLVVYCVSRSADLSLQPVEGTVTVSRTRDQLSRCTYGRVWLYPDRGKGNHTPFVPVAELGRDGRYRAYTDGRPGAPPGWYRVVVLAVEQRDRVGANKATQTLLVNRKYTEAETTDLALEVTSTPTSGAYDLVLR